MNIERLYHYFLAGTGITTDTRNLKKGALFFALKGANFNGNTFAQKAIDEGCSYAIVDEEFSHQNERIIKVDNVLLTLQALANFHRRQFKIPIIGITGSNGKTTSKELIGAVVSQKYNTLITEGNLNNHLGVPFTLLKLNKSHELAIIEMGANKPGDIKELVEIAAPDIGIITNVGAAHIEGFGSLQGVIDTKCEMYDYIGKHGKTIFYNAEDEILKKRLPGGVDLVAYGKGGDVDGELVAQTPFVSFKWSAAKVTSPVLHTHLVGKYNYTNFLLAVTVGVHLDVEATKINQALVNYSPSNNRSQVTKTNRNTLIVDCYNANATSMMAALESFVEMEGAKKLVILGDMLELGPISQEEHQKIVNFVEANDLNAFLIGSEMAQTKTKLPHFEDWQTLVADQDLQAISDTTVLLKGSRGIKLEALIQHL